MNVPSSRGQIPDLTVSEGKINSNTISNSRTTSRLSNTLRIYYFSFTILRLLVQIVLQRIASTLTIYLPTHG